MNIDSPENSSFTGKEKVFYSVFDPLDNDNSPKDHLWVPVPRKFDTSELGTLIFSSKLQKKSKTFGYWVTRYYFLFQDHLAYGSSKDPTKIKKYMPLEGLKAWLPRKKKKTPKQAQDHRLGLFRSNQFIELEMQDEQLLNEWVSHLRTRCIMVNFTYFYKMIGLLGKGSYGKVYLVENIEEKKRYAAKAIAKDHIVTRLLGVSSLFNEIGALKKLDHDKIVKLKEVFETPTSVYLIIEFIEGEELYTCLQRKVNFTEQESIILMKSILETLVYIHGKNIVHRDLKLENILITGSGLSDIKLIDFGLSVDVSEPFESKRGGTPGYIAPEVLNTENGKILISDKSDMFSLGCMLYRLLTGNKLFTGSTAKEILSRNKECYFNIGKPSVATLSNQAKDLLNKLLEKDPIKRISALEALNHPFFSQESIASCNELANTRENINIHSVAQYKFDVNHMKENNLRASTRLIDTNRNILSLSQFPPAPNSAAQIKPHAETILLDFTGHPTTVPLNIHGGECSVGGSLNPNSLTKIHNASLVSLKSLNSDSTSPSRFSSHFKLEAKLRSFSNKSLFKKSFSKKLLSQAMTPATTLRTKNEGGGGFSDYASLCDLDKDKKFPVVAESIVQSRKLGSIGEAKDGDSSNSNTTH